MATDLERGHCQRVANACALAVRHASLLLSESTQTFVNEILADPGPDRIASCLARITKRKPDAEAALLDALRILVGKLWKYEAPLTRYHFPRVLLFCWSGIAETLDRESSDGDRWVGGNGPRQIGEMTYQTEVIKPMIQRSFEILWEEQAKAKKDKFIEVG
jgi:hypothetical protein